MSGRLTSERVQEILDASVRSDVPAGVLIHTAERIRGALMIPMDEPDRGTAAPPTPLPSPPRSRRGNSARVAALVGTISLATTLALGGAGALPEPLQREVARGAAVVGINLPPASTVPDNSNADVNADVSGSPQPSNVGPRSNGGATPRDRAAASRAAVAPTGGASTGVVPTGAAPTGVAPSAATPGVPLPPSGIETTAPPLVTSGVAGDHTSPPAVGTIPPGINNANEPKDDKDKDKDKPPGNPHGMPESAGNANPRATPGIPADPEKGHGQAEPEIGQGRALT